MSVNIQIVNTAISSFQNFIDRVNLVINAMANGVLTANTDANGSVTIGNSFLNGIFAANIIHANTISGGNVQSNTGTLAIFCNTIFLGNSLVNATANSTTLTVPNGNFLIVTSNIATMANNITVGGAGTNSFVNSSYGRFTSLQYTSGNGATSTLSTSISIGDNVTNTSIVPSLATFAGNIVANIASLTNRVLVGTTLINTTSVNASAGLFATVNTTTTTVVTSTTIGTGTPNTVITGTVATFAGNVAANIAALITQLSVGSTTNTTINATAVTTNTIITGTPASAGFKANTSAIQLNGKTYTNLDPYVIVSNNATLIGTRPAINFISTASATAALVDSVINNRVDITLSSVTVPGGSDTYVQFNDAGVMNGTSGMTWAKAGNTLAVSNTITVANIATTAFKANATHISLNGKNYTNLDPYIAVSNSGVAISTARPLLNFISTASATLAIADNVASNRTDITVTAANQIAGSGTQVQFNDSGVFGATAGMTFAKTSNTFTVANTISAANIATTAFKANATHLTLNSKNYTNLDPYVAVSNNGTLVGTRPKINFIGGTSTTIDVTDQAGTDRVDVQISINAAAVSLGVIGGTSGQIEFNDAGVFNGHAGLTYAKTQSNLTVGNTVIAVTANVATVLLAQGKVDSFTNAAASASPIVMDSFFLTDYRGAEYLISIKDNVANNYQVSKVILVHDGGLAVMTEYATVLSNSAVGTFTASANATHAILNWAPTTSTSTTLKGVRQLIIT